MKNVSFNDSKMTTFIVVLFIVAIIALIIIGITLPENNY